MPTETLERIRDFDASQTDFNIAWLHDFNATRLEDAYLELIDLNYKILLVAEKLIVKHGYQSRWVNVNGRYMLEILPTAEQSLRKSFLDDDVNRWFFYPFNHYFGVRKNSDEVHLGVHELLDYLNNQ